MKKLLNEWRKQLEEYDITGVDYEPGTAQEEPAEEPEESTIELLNQLEDLIRKIKDSVAPGLEEYPLVEEEHAEE